METGAVVVWNTHLFSENYDITISCQNDTCSSKNKDTELLKLDQELTMVNTTLGFQYYPIYQKALVGCIVTTDSCTENHYWMINGAGMVAINCLYCVFTCFIYYSKGFTSIGGGIKISYPANKTTYYATLGGNLIVPCEAYGDDQTSVSWRKWETSVVQFTQLCHDFDESYSSKLCISPSIDDYQRERVKSRVLKFEECKGQLLMNSSLDISVVDWTDNGASYSCVPRPAEHGDITEEVYINIIVG